MNEAAMWDKVRELSGIITAAPLSGTGVKGATTTSKDGVYQSEILPKCASVGEALDQLRLQTKYLLFDLEATRRENRYLRQMLDTRFQKPQQDEDHGDTPPKWPLPGDP